MATISHLDRIEGPPCPACGCRHSAVEQVGQQFGAAIEVRRCRYCQKNWRHAPASLDEPVVYSSTKVICPHCGAKNPPVYSIVRKGLLTLRYHKCGEHNFVSQEMGVSDAGQMTTLTKKEKT